MPPPPPEPTEPPVPPEPPEPPELLEPEEEVPVLQATNVKARNARQTPAEEHDLEDMAHCFASTRVATENLGRGDNGSGTRPGVIGTAVRATISRKFKEKI